MSKHTHTSSCGCDMEEGYRQSEYFMPLIKKDPAAIIQQLTEASGAQGVRSLILAALATLAGKEPGVRRANAHSLFTHLILEGYKTSGHEAHHDHSVTAFRHWEQPLVGITNVLGSIGRDESQKQDKKILQDLCEVYPLIVAVIWRDLSHLLPPTADSRRVTIAQVLTEFLYVPGMHKKMLDETTISLSMHCWLYMSASCKNRTIALEAVSKLLSGRPLFSSERPGVLEVAVRSVTVDVISMKVIAQLEEKGCVNEALVAELRLFVQFSAARYPFAKAFVRAKVYHHVVKALQRQLKQGATKETADVLTEGNDILSFLATDEDISTSILIDLLDNTAVMDVVAKAFVISAKWERDDWSMFLMALYKPDQALFKAAQKAFMRVYHLGLSHLKANRFENSSMARLWEETKVVLKIKPVDIMKRWKEDKHCCNPGCPNRSYRNNQKVSACSRCQTVFYCGRDCQTKDWKSHKPHCSRNPLPNPKIWMARNRSPSNPASSVLSDKL